MIKNKFSLLSQKKCFIFDLDGTVYLGNKPILGTIDFIKKNANKYVFYFLTNNTSKTLYDYKKRLESFNIKTDDFQIISPIIPLVNYINQKNIKNIYLVGNDNLLQYITSKIPDIKIETDANKCEAVILGYDTQLTYEKIKIASLILHNNKKVEYIATHLDDVCPTENGPIPDVGSFISLLETVINRRPNIVLGKPNTNLIDTILSKYKKDEVVMVGDRLYTDFKLAQNASIDFILVLSGETTIEDVNAMKVKPKMVLKDLSELNI